jgi:hypothetical protein
MRVTGEPSASSTIIGSDISDMRRLWLSRLEEVEIMEARLSHEIGLEREGRCRGRGTTMSW